MLWWLIKILLWVTLVAFIIGSIYFSGMIDIIANIVVDINHEFIAYLPRRLRGVMGILVFYTALQVYYKFKK